MINTDVKPSPHETTLPLHYYPFHAPTMAHASNLRSCRKSQLLLCKMSTRVVPSSPNLSCLPTDRLTRKLKVLFVFTGTGSWSKAECQAVENSTAAWLILAMSGESGDDQIDPNLRIKRKIMGQIIIV